jgi:hypothetical protein
MLASEAQLYARRGRSGPLNRDQISGPGQLDGRATRPEPPDEAA